MIGHTSPEAAVGGPIALLEEGDMISIDVSQRLIKVDLSDAELAGAARQLGRRRRRIIPKASWPNTRGRCHRRMTGL